MTTELQKYSTNRDGILECLYDGVLVQRVPSSLLEGSELEGFDWCNTCNHNTKFKLSFFEDTPRQDDDSFTTSEKIQAWEQAAAQWRAHYNKRLSETRMDNWFPLLGDLGGERCRQAVVLTVTADQQRKYLEPVSQLAQDGGMAKQWYQEEAQELAAALCASSGTTEILPPKQGWFVRTAACSPKDAFQDGGSGPHHSVEAALLALMASDRVHRTLRKHNYEGPNLTVYLMPFDPEVHVERELRVFVHENKVRAISQYHVYGSSKVFANMTPTELAKVAKDVEKFHAQSVKPRWIINSSYTMDVEYIVERGGEIRLIELNSFGAEMAAASALFHWERDEELLYGPTSSEETTEQGKEVRSPICIRVRD